MTQSTDPKAQAGAALTTEALVVETSAQRQTMTGVGIDANVHSWDGGRLRPAIDRYTALGPLSWRVIIEKSDWESTRTGSPDVIDDAYYRTVFETRKMQNLWETLAYIESKPGQTVTLSLMGAVPEWMGGSSIHEGEEAYWVRMVAALVHYGRTVKGLRMSLVSPLNEPDWNGIEGPKVGPEQMVRLLERLSERLDALNLEDVRFVIPDTASAEAARETYLPALLQSPNVRAKIGRVGIHTYYGNAARVPDAVASGPAASAGVWATETNAWCDGCDNGTAPADSWDHAAEMAQQLLSLAEQGINGWQLYDAWDGYYEHHGAVGYWGALRYDSTNGTYAPRREFDVFSLFARGLTPGSVIVASSGASAVRSAAATDPATGRVSVMGVNGTGSTQSFAIEVHGAGTSSEARLTYATARDDGVRTGRASVLAGAVVVSVPADSVFLVDIPHGAG